MTKEEVKKVLNAMLGMLDAWAKDDLFNLEDEDKRGDLTEEKLHYYDQEIDALNTAFNVIKKLFVDNEYMLEDLTGLINIFRKQEINK